MSEYSHKVSFWKLLNDKKIVIPIIQRDYAQGREGREFLRERFLGQLFDALKDNATPLVLDFVYGSVEGDTFYPLDGQQRLTTLWLLHWYLALRAGTRTLSEDKNVLEKFSYETRISSRTFCQKLCGITQSYQPQQHGIAAFVRNQTWFYSAYEQDPTIQSMLRMLNGTDISDSNKMDITDGIEEYCIQAELTEEKAKELLKRLKGEDAPIGFYLLNMEDKNMPLADDLYIKMNARGKVLTDFENFKVDLLKYKLPSGEYLIPENDMSDESFSLLLDTRWTDLFWHYRSTECHIDEIYMSFLNRFFLNWHIAHPDKSADKVISSDLYKVLSAAEIGKGSHYRYQSISIYEPSLKAGCIKALSKCLNRMCDLYQNAEGGDNKQKLQAIDALFMPYWEEFAENGESDKANKIFSFIPRYVTDDNTNTPVPITLKQQVVFHAICVYLTNCEKVETENLKDWMHFVWNMVENSYLDSEQSVGAIRFFDTRLNMLQKIENNETPDQACDNIIDYLAGIDVEQINNDVFGRRQLLEEIAKAKQIKQNPDWKNKIHEAEKAAFFKGAIAFLFNNEKSETDWSNFGTKWDTAQELFDKDGVKADKTVTAMQTLYSYCDDWGSQFWWNAKIFNGKASTWKEQILTKVDGENKYVYAKPVHYLLMGAEPSKERKEDRRLRLLSSNSLIEHLVKENPKGQDMYIRYPHDSLYYCGKKFGVMLYYESRDKCLNELLKNNKIKLLAGQNEPIIIPKDEYGDEDGVLFWGNLDINFVYCPENAKPLHLQWYRERNETVYDIYLMNEDWKYKIRPTPLEDEKGDRKQYYCFNFNIDKSGKSLADQFGEQVEREFAEFIKNPAE